MLISASEYRPDDADLSHSPRFVGAANVRVRNISPHGPPFDPNHGVTFIVTVDWDSPVNIVTDITVLDAKPMDKGWNEFKTTRLPYTASDMDLGANTVHNGNLYIFFGDSGPDYSKPIAVIRQVRGDPSELADLGHVFLPSEYRIRFDANSPPKSIGQDQTPTGAFTYEGKEREQWCYVFAVYRGGKFPNEPWNDYVSALTWSPDPKASAGVFDFIPEALDGNILSQVAPVVVQNHEFPSLPESNAANGLIMLGQASSFLTDGTSGIHLAWMPLRPGLTPDPKEIWYYTGDAHAQRPWSQSSREAKRLVHLPYPWSSISLGRIPDTGKWILLYQKALNADPQATPPHDAFNEHGIYARIGATPWEWSEEFEIFNPDRDGAWVTGLMDDELQSYAYGAFLLNPYTRWDAAAQAVTIHYLMSTFSPYQAVVMRSTIKIPQG